MKHYTEKSYNEFIVREREKHFATKRRSIITVLQIVGCVICAGVLIVKGGCSLFMMLYYNQ